MSPLRKLLALRRSARLRGLVRIRFAGRGLAGEAVTRWLY